MLFEITRDQLADGGFSERFPSWIEVDERSVSITGDRTGFREAFVWNSGDRILVATTLEELLPAISTEPGSPAVSPFGISQILNHGFVPLPHTVYDGVIRLGPGDTASILADRGRLVRRIISNYPWQSGASRQDQLPRTAKLRELIASSVDNQLTSTGGEGFLMLSSGKDSVALALALADNGHVQVPCLTFKSGPGDSEHVYAAEVCDRLGLEHHTVDMPSDPAKVEAAMLRFFERSPIPSADPATIPYVMVAEMAGLDRGGAIDGSGNDGYMGYLPSSHDRIKHSLRIRNRRLAEITTKLVPHDSPLNYFARSRTGTFLPLRMFRERETRNLYGGAVDTESFWYDTDDDAGGLDLVDFIGVSATRHTDNALSNPKVYLVARSRGLDPLLPFCDAELADYYFNLPEENRFDLSARTNKTLLRQLLAEALDYDPEVVGSNYFAFDGASFLSANSGFVREEILSCDLWLPTLKPMLKEWMDALPDRPFLFHSLLALFMISGWHNHSVFRSPNPANL